MQRLRIDKLVEGSGEARLYSAVLDTHFVDTAYTETEGTTFDTGAVHVVSDQENQLQTHLSGIQQVCRDSLTLSSSLKCLAFRRASPASDNFLALCGTINTRIETGTA